MPDHHPPDDMLAAYSAGGAEPGESLLVATHLALCPPCRVTCDAFDTLGGSLLGRAEPVDVPPVDALLARLDEPAPPAPPPIPAVGPGDLPLPLRRYTGPLKQVHFRTVAPGIRRFDLPFQEPGRTAALVSVRPRTKVPVHRHSATERSLVLAGGFTDEVGHFVRGDVCVRGPEEAEPHRQVIDDGDDCIILAVDDGPKLATTLLGKVIVWLFG